MSLPRPAVGWTISFSLLGLLAVLVAIGLQLLNVGARLPAAADPYREDLLHGIELVQIGLIVLMGLSFTTAWLRLPAQLPEPELRWEWRDGWLAGLLLMLGGGLRIVNLNTSLWWDELSTLLRFVQRDWAVVFSFSGNCNNHVLTSLLGKASIWLFGEQSWALRLPMFLLGVALPPLAFALLRRQIGRPAALLVGLVFALHPSLLVVSTDARGYAGAVTGLTLSCLSWERVCTTRRLRWILIYIGSGVAAYGFLIHTILAPLAHGCQAVLAWFCWRHDPGRAATAITGIITALWTGVLAWVGFGLQLPQQIAYARSPAAGGDHFDFGWSHLPEVLEYVAGAGFLLPACACVVSAVAGWSLWRRSTLAPAFLLPALLFLVYVQLPGQLVSRRIFFMLLPAYGVGMGMLLGSILPASQRGAWVPKNLRGALVVILVGCVVCTGLPVYRNHFFIANPDLRGLAARLQGEDVVLCGQMADVNAYYFNPSRVYRLESEPGAEADTAWEAFVAADVIVFGTNPKKPHPPWILRSGFRMTECLPAWRNHHPEFRVYRKPKVRR